MKNHIKNAANANATTLRDLPAVRKLAEEQAHEVYERMVVVHGAPDLDVFLDLLFIPAPEHRDALFRDGVGGARVPTAHNERWAHDPPHRSTGWRLSRTGYPTVDEARRDGLPAVIRETALILIWRDEAAQEGCDRLARAIFEPPHALFHRWDRERVEALAVHAERAGLGRVVRVNDSRAPAPEVT